MDQSKPRIKSILYDIDVNKTVNIQSFIEKSFDYPDFTITFKDKRIIIHLKEPLENVAKIEANANSIFADWYYQYDLEYGEDSIRFYKKGYVYEELDPNIKYLSGNIYCKSTITCEGYAIRNLREFPIAHANFKTNIKLQKVIERYMGVLQGKEHILNFGYYYLTVIEDEFGDNISGRTPRRNRIGQKLCIDSAILVQLGTWTSVKGDEFSARKVEKKSEHTLSQIEEAWLHRCIRRLIVRHGEYLYDSTNLNMINLVDI